MRGESALREDHQRFSGPGRVRDPKGLAMTARRPVLLSTKKFWAPGPCRVTVYEEILGTRSVPSEEILATRSVPSDSTGPLGLVASESVRSDSGLPSTR